jgi:tape measure domain-containing protein
MADETVQIGIETELKGANDVESFVRAINGLDAVRARGLEGVEVGVRRIETQTKSGARAVEQFTVKVKQSGDAAADAATKQKQAEISAQKLAAAQTRAGAAAQNAATAQTNAATATTRAEQAQTRAAISAQALANAQARVSAQTAALNARLLTHSATVDRYAAGLNRAGSATKSIGQGVESAGRTLSIGITAPVIGLGVAVLDAAVKMDGMRRGLTVVAGSSAEAERQLERLRIVAQLPGIGFSEAVQGSIRLQAVGFNASTAERAIKAFANTIALTGGGAPELDRVIVQLVQMASKGKILTQDLRPIIEAAPAVGTALRSAFGTVNAEDINKLHLSTEKFFNKLFDAMEHGPKADANSPQNQLENLKTTIFTTGDAVGKSLLPSFLRFIQTVSPLLERFAAFFGSLASQTQNLVLIFAGVAAVAGPALVVIGAIVSGIGSLLTVAGAVLPLLAGIGAAVGVASGAIAPVVAGFAAVVAVLGLLVASVYGLYIAWTQNLGGIQQTASRVFGAVKSFVLDTLAAISAEWNAVLPQLKAVGESVLNAIAGFWSIWGDSILSVVTVVFGLVKTTVLDAIQIIGGTLRLILAVINGDWRAAWTALKDIVSAMLENVYAFLGAAAGIIFNLVVGIATAIYNAASYWISAGLELARSFLIGLVNAIEAAPGEIVRAVKYLFSSALSDLSSYLVSTGAAMWESVKRGFTGAKAASPLQTESSGLNPLKTAEDYNAKIRAQNDALISGPSNRPAERPNNFGSASGGGEKRKRGGGGGGGGQKRESRIPELNLALEAKQDSLQAKNNEFAIKLNKAGYDQQFNLLKDSLDRETKANDLALAGRKKSIDDFYRERQRIETATVEAEIQHERDLSNNLLDELKERDRQADAVLERKRKEIAAESSKKTPPAEKALKVLAAEKENEVAKAESLHNFELSNAAVGEKILILTRERAALTAKIAHDEEATRKALDKEVGDALDEIDNLNNKTATVAIRKLHERFDPLLEKIESEQGVDSPLYQAITGLVGVLSSRARIQQVIDSLDRTDQKRKDTIDDVRAGTAPNALAEARARQEILGINRQYLQVLKQELAALEARAQEEGADEETKRAIADRRRSITELETSLRSIKQEYKDAALNSLSSGFESFLEKLGSGVKTLKDLKTAAKDFFLSFLADLQKVAAHKLTQELLTGLFGSKKKDSSGDEEDSDLLASGDKQESAPKGKLGFLKSAFGFAGIAGKTGIPGKGDVTVNGQNVTVNGFDGEGGKSGGGGLLDKFIGKRSRDEGSDEGSDEGGDGESGGFFGKLTGHLRDGFTKVFGKLKGVFGSLFKGLSEGISAAAGAIKSVVSSIVKGIGGLFADGGAVSNPVRVDPVGYVRGPGTARSDSIISYFSAAQRVARISNTEYVLDAETTKNVGIARLDALRANRGRNFGALFLDRITTARQEVQSRSGFADGGAVSGAIAQLGTVGSLGAQQAAGGGDVHLSLHQANVIADSDIHESVQRYFSSVEGSRFFVNKMMGNNETIIRHRFGR